ncbi:FAD assembly factor SdhE [Candidatus Enterovibrio altilux]|uniref:FAD assembly factor SdhE n=1 Tax=Candidatus Enterovibrio altilux TaxID=1927128 RepID=A0A291BBB5_9GAMM|nr:succinate dehydrogenase assembly factor 2 [Candidatus Enterovibrio luxaltus]ATF10308.1 YgfY [Candidatus Enterovibrio luxaltus]
MLTTQDKPRIKWACRRGMLELDMSIMPFFEECFDHLSESEKYNFIALLEYDDPDLFAWLVGHTHSEKHELSSIIEKIIAYNRSKLH